MKIDLVVTWGKSNIDFIRIYLHNKQEFLELSMN